MHYNHNAQNSMSEFKQSKYINEFIKDKYDTIKVQVPKGQKNLIDKHWKNKGYSSRNDYITHLILKDIGEEILKNTVIEPNYTAKQNQEE